MFRLSRLLIVLLLLSAPGLAQNSRPLQIHFVDVEGGAATLIVTPAGESVLVDTGWPREDARDAKRIQAAAQQAGVTRIDHLITTHYHRDHWGGVAELVKLLPVAKFYDHGRMTELTEDRQNFPKLNAAYLASAKGQTHAVKPGDRIALKRASGGAPLNLLVLSSNGETLQRSGPDNPECKSIDLQQDDPSDNARSVGFVLEFGKFRFLDLGDLTWNTEHRLACPANVVGRIHLYQTTHHGQNTSNNTALLRSIRPQVAIMNNGPRKAGHPDVVKAIRQVQSVEDLYQGHRNLASSEAENASEEFIANLASEEGCSGHPIKVVVAPNGESFTVTNGRTAKTKKYVVRN